MKIKILFIILLVIGAIFISGGFEEEQMSDMPSQPAQWKTIYNNDYFSGKVNAFEFHPAKIKDWEIYPDHPCVKAKIEGGMLKTTTISLQDCWIEGLSENLLTHWSDVATVTHDENQIFPHPKIRMTARFMFPSKDSNEEYFFHMNPEIFTDGKRGNYNIFAQIRVSNKGNVIYVGENDKEMPLGKVEIKPDVWHKIVLEADMKTKKYMKASIDGKEWNAADFKSKFTLRKGNGMNEWRPFMGFWIGNNLSIEDQSSAGAGRDLYIDDFKVEIGR